MNKNTKTLEAIETALNNMETELSDVETLVNDLNQIRSDMEYDLGVIRAQLSELKSNDKKS